eukprot:COSAG01_NODE_69086_length_262_cov_0.926380_1_plen_53_part_01
MTLLRTLTPAATSPLPWAMPKRKKKKRAPALDVSVALPLVKQWYNAEEAVVPG